jgi:ribosome-associated protein
MTDDASTLPHGALDVAPGVRIPSSELEVHAITGSGPGGQHVNRSATRIVLRWNVQRTTALTDEQRARLIAKLAARIDTDGWIRIVSGEFRSQLQNRRAAFERLATLVSRALVVQKKRRPTKPTKASVERRLTEKKQRAEKKRMRRVDE